MPNDSFQMDVKDKSFLEDFGKRLYEIGAVDAEFNMECGTFTFTRSKKLNPNG